MKNGYKDCSWICCWIPHLSKTEKISSEKSATHDVSFFDPLFDFLTRDDVRIVCLILFGGLIAIGAWGSTMIKVGLPLETILPKGTVSLGAVTTLLGILPIV